MLAKNGKFVEAEAEDEDEILKVAPVLNQLRSDLREVSTSAVDTMLKASDELTAQTDNTILSSLAVIVALFIVSILASLWLSARGITGPISRLSARMVSLTGGETKPEIEGVNRKDEVGHMAKAVSVFRDNAIERARLEQEADANRCLSEKERIAREKQKAREAADTQFAVDNLASVLSRLSEGDVCWFPRRTEPVGVRIKTWTVLNAQAEALTIFDRTE